MPKKPTVIKKQPKPKASNNKAEDVETKEPTVIKQPDRVTLLWAKYGQLQAERERLGMQIQQIINQMQRIYTEIARLQEKTDAKQQDK